MPSPLQPLIDTLQALPPFELAAFDLLTSLRPQTGEWFPTTLTPEARNQVIAATVELVAYGERCTDMARRLAHLTPISASAEMLEVAHEPA